MEATISILARVPDGSGSYRLETVEKKRGSFIKPTDAISYYIRYTDHTARKRRVVSGGKSFNDAVVKAINIETVQNATRNGHQAPVKVVSSSERLTVTEAVAQWLQSFETRLAQWRGGADNGLSKNSVAAYTKTAKDFLLYCNQRGIVFMPKSDKTGEQAPDEVSADVLLSYESYLRTHLPVRHNQQNQAKDRQGSICTRFRNLSIFFAYFDLIIAERPNAHDGRGILKHAQMPRVNKAKKLREAKARQSSSVIIYSDEEIKAMLAAATVDESDLIKFALELGPRDKEIAHAEWTDIDGANFNFKDKPRFDWRLKDKERRTLPMSPKLVARLKARRARQDRQAKTDGRDAPALIFPNSLGNPDLGLEETIKKIVRRAKKSGFKWSPESEVTMHKFRKNYATFMHRAGCDLTTVRDLLGHSDTETTQLYIATNGSRAADVSKVAFQAFGD
jgi:integrase